MTDDNFLTKVVIDVCYRTFYIFSSDGDKKVLECEDSDQFMNVLEVVNLAKEFDSEVQVIYCDPITTPAGVV
jgi:hypothetical protein